MEDNNNQQFVNGITLNQQLADLLSIIYNIEDKEEQDKKINDYIKDLGNRTVGYSQGGQEFALKYVINSVIKNNDNLKEYEKSILEFYKSSVNQKLDVCDSEKVTEGLYKIGIGISREKCGELNCSVLKGLREIDFAAKPGILEMKPDDVRNLYNHMFDKDGNCKYNRITMDNCRKIF